MKPAQGNLAFTPNSGIIRRFSLTFRYRFYSMIKLLPGLHQFRTEIHEKQEEFFAKLAKKQSPDAIFITCSDSRVVPELLTSTQPGDLFTLRNAGNIVPMCEDHSGGEEASIEFAVSHLNVKDIIVCGHSQCGAMKGLLNPESLSEMPAVARWLRHAEKTKKILEENYASVPQDELLNIAVQENVLVQLENLRNLPCISRKLWTREVELHGWVYEIESGNVYIYDPVSEEFLATAQYTDGFELVAGANIDAASAVRKFHEAGP
jgi:carbonic anhydrase